MRRTARSSEARRSASGASTGGVHAVPQRTCVACRQVKAKRELIRVVRDADGRLSVDLRGKAPGRGAYLDPDEACLAQGVVPLIGGVVEVGEQHRDGSFDVLVGDADPFPLGLHGVQRHRIIGDVPAVAHLKPRSRRERLALHRAARDGAAVGLR